MEKIWKNIQHAFVLLSTNFWTLLVFELLYKIVILSLAKPVLMGFVRLAMRIQGLAYLSDETVGAFMRSPISWLFVILVILLWAFFTLFDICCIILVFHASHRKQKLPLLYLMKEGAKAAGRMVTRFSVLMVVYLLIIVPMTHSVFISGYISNFSVPGFIQDYIFAKPVLAVAYVAFWIFMGLKSQQWMYALHFFTLENLDFKKARSRSKRLIAGHYIQDVIVFVGCCVLLSLIYAGGVNLLELVVGEWCANHGEQALLCSLGLTGLSLVTDLWALIGYSLSLPLVYLVVSVMFYHRKKEKKQKAAGAFTNVEKAYLLTRTRWAKWLTHYRGRLIAGVIAGVLAVGFFVNMADQSGHIGIKDVNVEVCAHRGYAAEYPENTLPSFKGAIEIGADWIELDVQQTADGVLVISHDANLLRVSGQNIEINNVDYTEIKDLDVGGWFDKKYQKIHLTTLEEVLEVAKDQIRVNIEIKATGREINIEQAVADLVNQYDMKDQVVVSSMDYATLEHVKEADPTIETAYISSVSFGDYTVLDAADGYSVEENMLTRAFVRRAHRANKTVYVWTVNNAGLVSDAINLGVDVIISDDPVMVQKVIRDKKSETTWGTYLDKVRHAGS